MTIKFEKELLYLSSCCISYENSTSIDEDLFSFSFFSKNEVFLSVFKIVTIDDIPSNWILSVLDSKLSLILLIFVDSIILIGVWWYYIIITFNTLNNGVIR